MAQRRVLQRTPSSSGDVHPFLRRLAEEVTELVTTYQQERKPLLSMCQDYERERSGPDGKDKLIADHVAVLTQCFGLTEEEAAGKVQTIFAPRQEDLHGVHRQRSPCSFSFQPESMWRGTPSNPQVAKFARSMLLTGYRSGSVIESRTLRKAVPDMPDLATFGLRLGDGSQRVVAACVAWILLTQHCPAMPRCEPSIGKIVESLLDIPVNFEHHGDGSDKQVRIAQAARQNQAAQTLPVSTLQWIQMV